MNRVWVCFGLLILLCCAVFAGSSRPKITLRIHVQTEGKDLSPKQAFPVQLNNPVETLFFNAIPEITENDLIGIDSWPSNDQGQGLAARLQFDSHGTNALSNMTIQDQGKVMVLFLNGRVVYAPVIDSALNNGVLIVPRGFLDPEVKELQEVIKKNQKF